MTPPSSSIGIPTAEPKDGDFVAYLAQIEKRQLAALPARAAHAPPSLSGPHSPHTDDAGDWAAHAPPGPGEAERLRQQMKLDAGSRKDIVGAALMGLLGLFFTVQGLLGDGGVVMLVIGLFLLWRAWISARKAFTVLSSVQRDLATRLVDSLRQAGKP